MKDLPTIRKYLADLIRKERERRRKAEASVAELVVQVSNEGVNNADRI